MATLMAPSIPIMTADEAALLIANGDTVGFSGFTPAGAAKAVPSAVARRALQEHAAGKPYKIRVLTGASTGRSLDGALAKADAIAFRMPYQSDPDIRKSINAGKTEFMDIHLSLVPQNARYGFFGKVNVAVIEACDLTSDGQITLTSSVGASPTYARIADKIIVELNAFHPPALAGFHDIYEPLDPPHRRAIPVYRPSDRIGSTVIKVDPSKIVAVVRHSAPDETGSFSEVSDITRRIGENVAEFFAEEVRAGRIPKEFLPLQSGVGDTANAVLAALGKHPDIPSFQMYTEVIQDSVVKLMREGKISFASGCSLTVAPDILKGMYEDLEFFRPKMVLRPQEISNNPEVIRRLGILSVNTALEVDLSGNVNSTHVLGRNMMNGIGGSGDFARNAFLSVFTCPSTAKDGKISTIVPMVTHLDNSEHSVQVIVTEYGVADLRGKSPKERAQLIIDQCAHPDYREQLHRYWSLSKDSHTPHMLRASFGMHLQFAETGTMRSVDWSRY
jgi:succinate CoA transferase